MGRDKAVVGPGRSKADKRVLYVKKSVEKRISEDKCSACGQARDDFGKMCKSCKAKRTAYRIDKLKKGLCSCGKNRVPGHALCRRCKDNVAERTAVAAKLLREEVIKHYGNCCACCGETGLCFLDMDHKYGDGSKDKKGRALYAYIKKNKFPDKFQVLCKSCNGAKGTGEECPHVEMRRKWIESMGDLPEDCLVHLSVIDEIY